MASVWEMVAEGGAGPAPSLDWPSLKREIVAKLDVSAEYTALGVEFTRPGANQKGWRECHAVGRKDDVPSAAVNLSDGVYHDSGGEGLTLGFLDFALKFGDFGRWIDVVKHYAGKAGVDLGRIPSKSGGRIEEAHYDYVGSDGSVRYRVWRYRTPNGKKTFTQHPPDGRGGWKHGSGCMDGIEPVPYRLPGLIASAEAGDPIWIVEGERDADRLADEGLVATTNHQGAQSTDRTWPHFLDHFRGRDCLVIPDNDPGGRVHARKVAGYLHGVARSVKVVELPGVGAKGDVSDWLDSGHTIEELGTVAAAASEFDPSAPPPPESALPLPQSESDIDPSSVVTVCLSDVEQVAVEWLWPDRIPLGKITLLAGDPKLGKSFLTMDLAARVSTGGPIPCGRGECMPFGSVVLLSAEDDLDDTIKPRLVAAGANTDKIHALTTIRLKGGQFSPFNMTYIPFLELAVRRFPDTRLVIIDPVTSYLGSGVDDHKNSQVRNALGPLKELASACKVAVLIVTHLNKGTGTKALNRVSGSLAYTALSRANWLVAKDPDNPKRRLMLDAGNNLAEDPSGLAYSIVDGRVVWEPDPVLMSANEVLQKEHEERRTERRENPSKVEQAEAWLADLLHDGRSVPSADIFEQGTIKGFKKNVLYEVKERLGIRAEKQGFGHGGQWTWSLPAQADAADPPNRPHEGYDETPY
jgi:putative DNA primase/helicase